MQTRMLGLYTYGIAGIKKPAIYKEFQVLEDEHEVIMMLPVLMLPIL
ncbi:MAG: hypothetical protein GY801_40295 [bacterium]|nr:hypothetical protein [bacterium]